MKRWYFPIKRVKQADDHGCGIAATAIACGVTYARARSEFFPRRLDFKDDESLHVGPKQIVNVIHKLGFTAKHHAGQFRHIDRPVIVPFSWLAGNEDHADAVHAVVWDPFEKRILDPGLDHERSLTNGQYFNLWRLSKYDVIIVTGKVKANLHVER